MTRELLYVRVDVVFVRVRTCLYWTRAAAVSSGSVWERHRMRKRTASDTRTYVIMFSAQHRSVVRKQSMQGRI